MLWLGRVGLAGQATPAAYQNVGAPWLWHDLGPANRRCGLEAQATAGIDAEHLGVLQLVCGGQRKAATHRSLSGLGRVIDRLRRKTLMQLGEGLAAGKFCPLLVAHR